jgi:MtN3 and saliva related transmembrane protein
MQSADYVGGIAAVCTTGAYIPQIVKIIRRGAEDLSWLTLFIYLVGLLLWLAYGLVIHSPSVIWANAITSLLVCIAIFLKITFPYGIGSRARQAQPDESL